VMAIDLPGSGGSDKLGKAEPSIVDFSEILLKALKLKGITNIDLYGKHAGTQVAIEMVLRRPDLIKHLILEGVMLFSKEKRTDLASNYAPAIKPQWDGSHLISAWHMLRDQAYFWPWYNRTQDAVYMSEADAVPDLINQKIIEVLKDTKNYSHTCKAVFSHPTSEMLSKITTRTLLCSRPDDYLHKYTQEAGNVLPGAITESLPEKLEDIRLIFDRFLGTP
ncbi:alpha/beta fold hydrolase, partial [Thermodesulfobacteriota bacterium]